MDSVKNCSNCANAIFVALWGEYKCGIRQHMIFKPELVKDCEYHKEGTPQEAKSNSDYNEKFREWENVNGNV